MRITAVRVDNFKGARHVEIHPGERGLLIIGGLNEAGKSSTLDAITWAFGGGKVRPKDPVHHGAEEAVVEVDVQDGDTPITIRRRYKASTGKEQVVIETGDGLRQHSPQTWLTRVIGERFLDPLAFTRQDDKAQRAMLLRVLGVGDELDRLEADRADLYMERRVVNRDLKAARSTAATIGTEPAIPAAVDVSAIQADRYAAEKQAGDITAADQLAHQAEDALDESHREVKRLREQLEDAQKRLGIRHQAVDASRKVRADLPTPQDTFILDDQLAAAAEANRAHVVATEAHRQWSTVTARAAELEATTLSLTERIDGMDKAKAGLVTSAALPVEGLGVTSDAVTYNGVRLDQCSSSARLRVSLAIAEALRPELRAIWLQGGQDLDDGGLKIVEDFADAHDLLVILERVGTGDFGAVIIENGEVKQ